MSTRSLTKPRQNLASALDHRPYYTDTIHQLIALASRPGNPKPHTNSDDTNPPHIAQTISWEATDLLTDATKLELLPDFKDRRAIIQQDPRFHERSFVTSGNPYGYYEYSNSRAHAAYTAAFRQLIEFNLIVPLANYGNPRIHSYEVTHLGFQVVDALRQNPRDPNDARYYPPPRPR